jgi:hypothetical protein
MKHAVPDDRQKSWLNDNGINTEDIFVVHDGGDYILAQNYKTGDEIVVRRNSMKKKEVAS